jgi:hypothetical protein
MGRPRLAFRVDCVHRVEQSASRVLFEMKASAQTVRLVYEKTGPDTLKVTFDETETGQPATRVEFPYTRVRYALAVDRRFGEQLLEPVVRPAAGHQPGAVAKDHGVLAVEQRLQLPDAVGVDDRRSMDADEL